MKKSWIRLLSVCAIGTMFLCLCACQGAPASSNPEETDQETYTVNLRVRYDTGGYVAGAAIICGLIDDSGGGKGLLTDFETPVTPGEMIPHGVEIGVTDKKRFCHLE